MTDSTLISGGTVVTVDDDNSVHDPGWVVLEGDRIAAVGTGAPPAADRRFDATGMAVMPGMVNAHTHLFQTFFRGQADDKPLLEWIRECIWPAAVHMDPDAAYLAAMVGLIENLRGGATSVIDHQYIHLDESFDHAVCRAAEDLGVRFLLARGWADRNYHPDLTEPASVVVDRAEQVHQRWDGAADGRIRIELAPLIPWGCSDEGMSETVAASRRWGRGTHIHCAETAVEVDMNLDERGLRHVHWLDELGVLGPDVQLAHSVWLDDDEIDRIASAGAVVVHCPVSNMYLASGVARIHDMRARGVQVALASDGAGSNNRQDMFESLKATVLLQKVHRLDAMAVQPEEAIEMACRGGAAAFGLADEIGAIEPGRKADLVVVDLRSPFVMPVHRVPSALVFCATPRDVHTVIVDGRMLVTGGEVVGVDEPALLAEAETAAAAVFDRAGVPTRLVSSDRAPISPTNDA